MSNLKKVYTDARIIKLNEEVLPLWLEVVRLVTEAEKIANEITQSDF